MKTNLDLSADYWDQRYQKNDFGWDLGEISTPLKNYFDQLSDTNSFILIPGAGNSYEAEYLHNKGFKQVYICDFALSPLDNFKKRNPNFPASHLLHIDFFEIKDLQFDLIIEQTFFCALSPDLRNRYFLKMESLLKKSGKLVGLLFDDDLNTDKPPYGGHPEEYKNYYKNIFKAKHFESCYNSIKPRAGREIFMVLEKQAN